MQFFWLSLNIMLRLLGLVRLSNLCKSNPNVFSLIYSIACLTLSFLWSQWQEQICISLDVSTQARLVWFWKAQLCPSAVCCGKVTLLVGVAKRQTTCRSTEERVERVAAGWSQQKTVLFKYFPWFCECCQCWIAEMDTSARGMSVWMILGIPTAVGAEILNGTFGCLHYRNN